MPVTYTANRTVRELDVKVYPVFYKQLVVEWSIPASWGAATFNVFRSQTEYGPWALLNDTPISGNHFKDLTTVEFSKFSNNFYLVDAFLPNGRVIRSFPETWINRRTSFAEIRAQEIQRRELLLLTKFTGVKSLIFRKRTFGARCTNCWDSRIEKITKDHCEVCLGTSFEGGYFPGFESLVQYDPTPNQAALSYSGKIEPNTIPAWTVSFPEINTFDLIVRLPDFKVYRVDGTQSTELQSVTVRQMLNLNELDKESIEFKLINDLLPTDYRT
jgi:hypothetical protein